MGDGTAGWLGACGKVMVTGIGATHCRSVFRLSYRPSVGLAAARIDARALRVAYIGFVSYSYAGMRALRVAYVEYVSYS